MLKINADMHEIKQAPARIIAPSEAEPHSATQNTSQLEAHLANDVAKIYIKLAVYTPENCLF
jgi:hypothetical protein